MHLSPEQQATLQYVGDVALGVQFDFRKHKKRGDLPVSVTAAQTMTNCGFWRQSFPLWMTRKPKLSYFAGLPPAACRISSRPWTRGSAACRLLEDFPALLGTHGHMISRKLLAMEHLEGLHYQIIPQHLVHGGFAHTGCGGQSSAALAKVSSQLFPRIFEELRGAVTPFSSAPWSVKGVFSLLELLQDPPHRWTVHVQSFLQFHYLFFLLSWSLITVFRSTSIIKLIFEIFDIPSLKVVIVSFQMAIILQKLTTLKEFYGKTKIGCPKANPPCTGNRHNR